MTEEIKNKNMKSVNEGGIVGLLAIKTIETVLKNQENITKSLTTLTLKVDELLKTKNDRSLLGWITKSKKRQQ